MGGLATAGLFKESKLTLSVAGNANVALTTDQAQNGVFEFTGALTGNINVTVPDAVATGGAEWKAYNNTTGAFTLTLKTVSGTGVAITQGKMVDIYSDATNLVPMALDAASLGVTPMGYAAITFPSDANYTLLVSEYRNRYLTVNPGTISTTRNLVVPLTPAGRDSVVFNNNAQAVQVIGASGTGITIAAGKTATVYSNATNILRATADV